MTRHATELSETSRPRRGSTPSNLQTSNDEDTIMIDINAVGDSSDRVSKGSLFTPEPRSDTPTSSRTKDNKSSNRSYKTDVAMKSVDTENDFHKSPPKTSASPSVGK